MVDNLQKLLIHFTKQQRDNRQRRIWGMRPVVCRLGCGVEGLQRLAQFRHETRECLFRVLPCPLGCGETMRVPWAQRIAMSDHRPCSNLQHLCTQSLPHCQADDHHRHMADDCEKRLVDCERGCGMTGVKAVKLRWHTKYDCPLRPVSCKYDDHAAPLKSWQAGPAT